MNIRFRPSFEEWERILHIDRHNVVDAILHYDKKQPFSYEGLKLQFYSKKQETTQTYVVVCGRHEADDFIVDWALSILSSQLESEDNCEPLSLIQQIALKFGLTVRIGQQLNRFILRETIRIQRTQASNYITWNNPKNHSFCICHYANVKEDSDGLYVSCALIFCIDADEYLQNSHDSISHLGCISITPQLKSKITPIDFTNTEGTITFSIAHSEVGKGGRLFAVSFPKYFLEVGFAAGELYIRRNEYWTSLSLKGLEFEKNMVCIVYWGLNELRVTIQGRTKFVRTPATVPPNEILQWARKLNVLPTRTYNSREDLYQVMLMAIKSIQDKVKATNMYQAFWDLHYDASRTPKKEISIVSTIHGLLFDIASSKNFQLYPEHPSGGGKLDFLIGGYLTSGEVVKVCIEFKHAHSQDLHSGLTSQLPAYMYAETSSFGIYCVLYFKGEYFDKPEQSKHKIEFELHKASISKGLSTITTVIIDLSKPLPPSKL